MNSHDVQLHPIKLGLRTKLDRSQPPDICYKPTQLVQLSLITSFYYQRMFSSAHQKLVILNMSIVSSDPHIGNQLRPLRLGVSVASGHLKAFRGFLMIG